MEWGLDITVNAVFMKNWKISDQYCGRSLKEKLTFTNFNLKS